MIYEHYLFKKYGHTYRFLDYSDMEHNSGEIIPSTMVTMPMPTLVDIYKQQYNIAPKTFLDCGAGFGYMLRWAKIMGIDAHGIDIRRYPFADYMYKKYYKNGRIKICNLLDAEPFTQDLAYANCVFSYLDKNSVDEAICKFKKVKMLVAIHHTTEDVVAAQKFGTPLKIDCQARLVQPNDWWVARFQKNGFDAVFDKKHSCFCAIPKTR